MRGSGDGAGRGVRRFAASGSGSGGGPVAACLFISQRMTVMTAASAVAAVMMTNPPATHCVALTASPERDGPAFCSSIRPAVSAPTM